ncbi:MAG TPA: SLC13 family permease, partial [Thermoanaerobaculia bacterium]|nr:SLC13 family permease [Thermoanaerobaculia bacterium]
MTWEIGLVLAILAGAVVLFASERYPIDLTAMLVLGSLLLFRLVSPEEGVSGFANPATVTVAAMFVLTAGLQKTGSVAFFGRLLVRFGRNRFLALLIVMLATAALSAFVNNTAAVAIFIPLVMTLSQRRRLAASKLLIPLSYASQFGGVCTLIGTSTNLLVSAISHGAGHGAFSMFELTRMGLVFFVAGTLYFLFLGQWLLPERAARQLSEQYGLGDFITELRVGAGSPLLGKTVLESRLGEEHDVTVLRLLHGAQKTWAPLRQPLQEGYVLLVRGGVKELMGLRGAAGLELNVEFKLRDDTLETEDQRLVQALVAPHSPLIGQTLKTIDFRARYKALVLAIQRRGVTLQEKLNRVRFELGDTLLIQAPRAELERLRTDEAFIVLEGWEDGPGRRHKAPLALLILGTVVGLAAFDLMPILAAALLGVLALVLTRCLSTEEVYTAIDWQVIFLLAGILPLGIALQKSGA